MNGLTKIITASALGLGLSVSAMAADGAQNNISSIDPSVSDLSYAFDNNKDLQVSSISNEEMTDTQGAVAPWVIGAGVGGALQGGNYAYGAYKGNYQWSNAKFAGNIATGAVIGGSFGAAGRIASGGAKFVPSLTNSGANIWRMNSTIANTGANQAWRNDGYKSRR